MDFINNLHNRTTFDFSTLKFVPKSRLFLGSFSAICKSHFSVVYMKYSHLFKLLCYMPLLSVVSNEILLSMYAYYQHSHMRTGIYSHGIFYVMDYYFAFFTSFLFIFIVALWIILLIRELMSNKGKFISNIISCIFFVLGTTIYILRSNTYGLYY